MGVGFEYRLARKMRKGGAAPPGALRAPILQLVDLEVVRTAVGS
ncbi:MAG: hypothetical protein ACYC2H_12550 [Thermoplasmatota archaeon]